MRLAPILALPFVLAACPDKKEDTKPADAAVADAAPSASTSASAGGEDVQPVYPIEPNAPANPLAEKLCTALSEMPEKKRAECCKTTPGVVVTSECTRMLSAAIRHGAIDLAESDVTACIAAFDKTLSGCDWVGPFPPGPPDACLGIFKGKIAAGKKCRSSLECAGDMRCLGAGPTTPGTCGPAKANADLCGGTTDTLAGFTRQSDVDKRHPECKERCIKHKCAPAAADGEGCQVTADCADGMQCLPVIGGAPKVGVPQKKCTAKPLPKEGEPCPGGVCEGQLSCIKNKCAARKPAGEECTADFECKGGCLKGDGGDKGKCGPRCDLR